MTDSYVASARDRPEPISDYELARIREILEGADPLDRLQLFASTWLSLLARLDKAESGGGIRALSEPASETVCEAGIRRKLLRLAVALHAKHYSDVAQWQPLEDAYGLIDQIDNMSAGLTKADAGWQDISTAPKDSSKRVLVWIAYTPEGAANAGVPGREEVARRGVHGSGWLLDHDCCVEDIRPTHWKPLGPPPVGSGRNLADATNNTPHVP